MDMNFQGEAVVSAKGQAYMPVNPTEGTKNISFPLIGQL